MPSIIRCVASSILKTGELSLKAFLPLAGTALIGVVANPFEGPLVPMQHRSIGCDSKRHTFQNKVIAPIPNEVTAVKIDASSGGYFFRFCRFSLPPSLQWER
jgi:hypothetical protein